MWQKASRIGLREDEGILHHRDVVFLNRVLTIMPIVLTGYLPFEIMLNGFGAVHLVIIFMVGLMLPLVFNHYRLFVLARYYSFLVATVFILGAGLSVGKGINNHVALIPMALLAIILLHSRFERIMAVALIAGAFLLQQYLFDHVEPSILIPAAIKPAFSNIFFILALLLNFLLGYYFIGLNSEYESVIVSQKEALAGKNKEITDSITYAKRIQASILPPGEAMHESLGMHFVLYKPKDIVAGDFYWLRQAGDTTLFAVADCTGHGVPGALVSVVCNNALNRCVQEYALTAPAAILDKAREIIISEFAKSQEEIKDGMDISLCAVNRKSGELRWAGANNPLLVASNGTLLETRPDKQPVGRHSQSQPFTDHRMAIREGDVIYVFSDGFGDQFGGPKGKKFKYNNFKNLLLSIHSLDVRVQKERLEKELERWKGELEQVDDVCVVGVKV
jgi:serine phosphatase RsbU (regulator of sigma subunit)